MLIFRLVAVLFLLIVIIPTTIFSQEQEIKFETLKLAEDSLPSSTINSIVQDNYGYLWFGTIAGLVRFDGYSFYTLKYQANSKNSLSNGYINSLAVDKSNNIWIATNGGVNKYNTNTEEITVFRKEAENKNRISGNTVAKIYIDSQERVWVGTAGNGVNVINPDGTISFFLNDAYNANSISNNNITAIFQDSQKRIWIGTMNGLNLLEQSGKTFKKYHNIETNPNSINSSKIVGITQSNDGTLWICTSQGLNKYNPQNDSFSSYQIPKTIDEKETISYNRIVSDKSGFVWISSAKGLFCFNPKTETFKSYHKNDLFKSNLSDNLVKEIFFDSEGRLWVGTTDKGINTFDPNSKRFSIFEYPQNNRLKGESVSSIFEDSSKTLWISTTENFIKYNPKGDKTPKDLTTQKIFNDLSTSRIKGVFETSSGLIWITANKLMVYDPSLEIFVTEKLNLPKEVESFSGHTFLEDDKGNLWIGSFSDGICKFNLASKNLTFYRREDRNFGERINSSRVVSLRQDKKGNIWAATRSGLNLYDPVKDIFVLYDGDTENTEVKIPNSLTSMYISGNNILWIGTEQGLYKLEVETKKLSRIDEKNSNLSSNFIYGVLVDDQENIWLSTNKGISKYEVKTKKFYNYDERDGLQGNDFNFYAYFKSKSGELFFGGVNGLNKFYPNNNNFPKIAITSIKVLDENYKTHMEKIFTPENYYLELPYNFNYLTFSFSALAFTNPEKNKYKYKLEGHEKEWIETDSKGRIARYSKLEPGDYTFRVLASNNDGIWNEIGKSVKIHIFPPWWKTNWAYFFYFLTFSSVLYGSHHYRLSRLEKRNRELETKVEQRTKEINDKNILLEEKNQKLAKNYEELLLLNQRANCIFAALSEALPGTTFDGKYHLEEKIGSGGFGAVYRATHLKIKKEVAIKVFSPSPGNDSVENLERFQQEAISACRVNHPNAVAVLDSGISSDGIPYLVMEMLKGCTLKAELRKRGGRLSVERAAQIIVPICKALIKAHSSGVIHRDIKPDNIFLHNSADGEIVKVLDFGIAKLVNPNDSATNNVIETVGLVGTPLYMAPERLAMQPYDVESDIYSLGSVIYEMLCGQAPFQKHSGSLPSIIIAQLNEHPTPLNIYLPTIANNVEEIILGALKKEPSERPTLTKIVETFARIAGIEYKQVMLEEKSINYTEPNGLFDQSTILVANKIKSKTDEITPSQQITLYNLQQTNQNKKEEI
jgi:ligand-binding sensor domain-containing protein/serine/threonine protein kinase